jgi:hypothetical protein
MEKKKTADRGREFLFARRVQQRMLAFDELPRVHGLKRGTDHAALLTCGGRTLCALDPARRPARL